MEILFTVYFVVSYLSVGFVVSVLSGDYLSEPIDYGIAILFWPFIVVLALLLGVGWLAQRVYWRLP